MALTLLEAGTEIDRIIGNRENDGTYAQAKVWANRAYHMILSARPFRETLAVASINTVASTTTISLPSDFYSVLSLRDTTNDARLIQLSLQRYDGLDTDTEGAPEYYAIGDGVAYLWRTPDAVYALSLRYRKRLAEWTTDGTAHALPTEWDQIIVLMGAYLGFLDWNEEERAQSKRNQAAQLAAAIEDPLVEDLLDLNEPVELKGLYGGY